MKSNLKLATAAASLALASASQAQQISKPLSSLMGAGLRSQITCHGISDIPMTSDQEQSLPLRLVATLNCGQEVAILSDSEGYTVGVRTTDGKTGFIARMYLASAAEMALKANRPLDHTSDANASAAVQNGVARWELGKPGSDQIASNQGLIESLTVNGVTVQVSLQDTGWKLRANVAIDNGSAEQIAVYPSRFSLTATAPTVVALRYQNPKLMAKAPNHQVLWTDSTATAPSFVTGQRSITGFGQASIVDVSYKISVDAPSTPSLFTPPADDKDSTVTTSHHIQASALREGIVRPNSETEGAVWFERDKHAEQLLLRVPVNGLIFEFPLSFSHQK